MTATSSLAKNFFDSDETACSHQRARTAAAPPLTCCQGGIPTYGTPGQNFSSSSLPNPLPSAFCFQGRLIVVSDITVNAVTMYMIDAAEIHVNPGVTLTLTNNTVIEGCQSMWKGITLDLSSGLQVASGSQINDAVTAISVTKPCTVDLNGGRFYRNFRTLWAMPPNSSNLSFNLYAADNIVDGSGPLKSMHSQQAFWEYGPRGDVGFWFVQCSNVGNSLKVGEIGDPANLFRHLNYGVLSSASYLTIENSRFEEFDRLSGPGYFIGGYGIYGESGYNKIQQCTLFHCYNGIGMYKMNFLIQQNHFTTLHTAVYALQSQSGAQPPKLYDNTVDGANNGFLLVTNNNSGPTITDNVMSGMGLDAIGVFDDINLQNRSFIYGNIITLAGGGGWPDPVQEGSGKGIHLVTTRLAEVCANSVSHGPDRGTNIGLHDEGGSAHLITNNDFVQTSGPVEDHKGMWYTMTDNSVLDCNSFTQHTTGMIVQGVCTGTSIRTNKFFGLHYYGMVFNQATTQQQVHTGNRWFYTTSATYPGAVNIGSDVNLNKFFVDCAEDPALCPVVQSAQGWFQNQATPSTTISCENNEQETCTTGLPEFQEGDYERIVQIMNGDLGERTYPEPSYWLAERQALGWIAANGLQDTEDFQQFWQERGATSQGQLAQIQADDAAWRQENQGVQAEIAALYADLLALMEGDDQSDAARDAFENKRQQLHELQETLQSSYAAFLEAYAATNAALPETDIWVYNHKRINALLLELYQRDTLGFSAEETALLDEIAAQCSFEGGVGVLQARYLLALTGGHAYYDADVCGEAQSRSALQKNAFKANSIRVFPNPTSESFTLELKAFPAQNRGMIRLYDRTGREVWRKVDCALTEQHRLPPSLPSGHYRIAAFDQAGQFLGSSSFILK